MKYPLCIVTSAPGSGKSTTLSVFIELQSHYIAFDIDWLADVASALANKDIYADPGTWKPYASVWFEVLHAVHKNHRIPVFFTPNDPHDIEHFGQPAWCSELQWLLLDCDDQTRRDRLIQRLNWTEAMIAEACADARSLRQAIPLQVDTGLLSPKAVASRILDWLEQVHGEGHKK